MRCKSYKEIIEQGIARCEENLLTEKDPIKRDIIQRQIFDYKHTIKQGIPTGDNSISVKVDFGQNLI